MPERSQRTERAWTGGLASTRQRRVTLDDSTTIKGLNRPANVITGASAATDIKSSPIGTGGRHRITALPVD